jgi:phasin family protein
MILTQEQTSAANKANLETLTQLSRKAFDGVEKLMELNLQVAKTLMQESVDHLQDTSKAKDVKEFLGMQANFLQPMAEKAIAYNRHFYTIANETQANLSEITKTDIEIRTAHIQNLISEISAQNPGSSDAMVNMIKQAVSNANTAFEASQKALKQAIDMSSHQTQSATESAFKASEKIFKSANAN